MKGESKYFFSEGKITSKQVPDEVKDGYVVMAYINELKVVIESDKAKDFKWNDEPVFRIMRYSDGSIFSIGQTVRTSSGQMFSILKIEHNHGEWFLSGQDIFTSPNNCRINPDILSIDDLNIAYDVIDRLYLLLKKSRNNHDTSHGQWADLKASCMHKINNFMSRYYPDQTHLFQSYDDEPARQGGFRVLHDAVGQAVAGQAAMGQAIPREPRRGARAVAVGERLNNPANEIVEQQPDEPQLRVREARFVPPEPAEFDRVWEVFDPNQHI